MKQGQRYERPLDGVRYRDCAILLSGVVQLGSMQKLYAITGKFEKTAAKRPFLVTVKDAMEWIDAQHTAEKVHASC